MAGLVAVSTLVQMKKKKSYRQGLSDREADLTILDQEDDLVHSVCQYN